MRIIQENGSIWVEEIVITSFFSSKSWMKSIGKDILFTYFGRLVCQDFL